MSIFNIFGLIGGASGEEENRDPDDSHLSGKRRRIMGIGANKNSRYYPPTLIEDLQENRNFKIIEETKFEPAFKDNRQLDMGMRRVLYI